MSIKNKFTHIVKPFLEFDRSDRFSGSPAPGSHKWTDIIDDAVWDSVFSALDERTRLVGSGLYSESDYTTLCSFTGFFTCDYERRFQWCCSHYMIEYRGRSTWSHWFHDSPVDHILTVYMPDHNLNIKGYKDGKHVLEDHLVCRNYDEYCDRVIDRYYLLEKNPSFIGHRIDGTAWYEKDRIGNWIAEGNGVTGKATCWILEDEPLVRMLSK